MSSDTKLVSKVLILDNSADCIEPLKEFCAQNGLIGLSSHSNVLLTLLGSYVDLGGILMAEDYADSLEETAKLANQIRTNRPELPIILRRKSATNSEELPADIANIFCATYTIEDLSPLRKFIDEHIFSFVYPNALIRGISEITVQALESQFKHHTVTVNAPYIVRDRIIFGEVFSLIPLESNWCRGYMMIQTEESVLDIIIENDNGRQYIQTPFRALNNLIGEVTNLIWGAFKNRYFHEDIELNHRSAIQVPLVINHQQKYISFGAENPQLCFKYNLFDDKTGLYSTIYQWFIFNLYWSPEDFQENQATIDELLDSGELELF